MAEIHELRPTVPKGPAPAQIDPRRNFPIDVRQTSLPVMTTVAWEAVKAANEPPKWFLVGEDPVRIVEDANEPIHMKRLGMDGLGNISAQTAWWHKFTEKDGESEQFPLERVLKNMLVEPNKPLPPLRRIVAAPVFGPRGTLSTAKGYDPDSGNYYAPGDTLIETIPDKPTAEDVEWAKSLIFDEFLVDFPFVGPSEKAHALSLMLNPFIRDMIDGPTPMYLIEAPAAGTGKSLLANLLMYPALGEGPVLMTQSNSDEETRKRLTSTLMDIPEAVLIDNVAKGLDSPSMSSVLTGTNWTDRVLGKSENQKIPIRCTWIATGNNPTRSNEMSRRLIRIRLDARAERPEERENFRHKRLDWWVKDNRHQLIRACLILVQRWITTHGNAGSNAVSLGSYEAWKDMHSGILECIGVDGFLANKREAESVNRDDDIAWEVFVDTWWNVHHAAEVTANELLVIAREIDDFPLGRNPTEKGEKIAFGIAMNQHRDRVFNGFRVEQILKRGRGKAYRLQEAEMVKV